MHHYEDLMLKTKDGVKVHAYLITRPDRRETKAAPTLLFLHVRLRGRRDGVCTAVNA